MLGVECINRVHGSLGTLLRCVGAVDDQRSDISEDAEPVNIVMEEIHLQDAALIALSLHLAHHGLEDLGIAHDIKTERGTTYLQSPELFGLKGAADP